MAPLRSQSLFFASFLPLIRPAAASSAFFQTKNQVLDCTVSVLYLSSRHYSKRRKMAPKKPVVEEKILLGRPGNNLKSGIVGCPPGQSLTRQSC